MYQPKQAEFPAASMAQVLDGHLLALKTDDDALYTIEDDDSHFCVGKHYESPHARDTVSDAAYEYEGRFFDAEFDGEACYPRTLAGMAQAISEWSA